MTANLEIYAGLLAGKEMWLGGPCGVEFLKPLHQLDNRIVCRSSVEALGATFGPFHAIVHSDGKIDRFEKP